MRPIPTPIAPGQESVWDYPRPAVAELTKRRLRIAHRGVVLADTVRAVRTLETSHPPTYYFPSEDVDLNALSPVAQRSFCEWKGWASYFTVSVAGDVMRQAAWSYPAPSSAFAALKDHFAFYASPFDSCTVDDEQVTPQPGGFYGGWITTREAGPFKGGPGTQLW